MKRTHGLLFFLLAMVCCRKTPAGDDGGPTIGVDGWSELAATPWVTSVRPLPGGGFLVVGASGTGAMWLLKVDAAGRPTERSYDPGYIAAATPMRDGQLAVAGGTNGSDAFVAKIDAAGKMIDIERFHGDPGSEIDAVAVDGDRIWGVGLENPPRLGGADGWIVGAGGGPRVDERPKEAGHPIFVGAAVASGTLYAVGGGGPSSTFHPWAVTRAADGTLTELDRKRQPANGQFWGAIALEDGGVALIGRGSVIAGNPADVTYVDFLDRKGALRLRATLPAVEGDMIGPAIHTSTGIAFTTASGPVQIANGGIAVVALDGRYAFLNIEGTHGKLDMRHIAYYALSVDHGVVRFLRTRTNPRFAWRVDEKKIPPLEAPPPQPPVVDAGKLDGSK